VRRPPLHDGHGGAAAFPPPTVDPFSLRKLSTGALFRSFPPQRWGWGSKRKRLSMVPLPVHYARLARLFSSPPQSVKRLLREGALRHNKRGGESGRGGGVRLGQLGVDLGAAARTTDRHEVHGACAKLVGEYAPRRRLSIRPRPFTMRHRMGMALGSRIDDERWVPRGRNKIVDIRSHDPCRMCSESSHSTHRTA